MQGAGQTIKRWRQQRGISQQALAVLIGMSTAAVTQWERDVTTPKRETAIKLDEALAAGGEIMSVYGYTATVDMDTRISQLEAEVETLRRQLLEVATVVRELGERTLLPDADEQPHRAESRTAR